MFSRAARARAIPFLIYIAFIFVADMLGRAGVSAEQLRWLYPVKIAAVCGALVVFWAQYQELAPLRLGWKAAAAAVLLGTVVLILWINLGASWMMLGASAGYDPRSEGALLWPLVAVRLAGAALVVPVMEELFWRSFLLRWLDQSDFERVAPTQVVWRSMAITAALFGVEHNLWLAGIVAGLGYSLLYQRTGQLWAAILAHGVTNGLLGVWIICTGSWSYW